MDSFQTTMNKLGHMPTATDFTMMRGRIDSNEKIMSNIMKKSHGLEK